MATNIKKPSIVNDILFFFGFVKPAHPIIHFIIICIITAFLALFSIAGAELIKYIYNAF